MKIGPYVRRLDQALTAVRAEALRDTGLTVPQYIALCTLAASPGSLSAAQLARVSLVTPQTMSTIITNLEAKGLLERSQSELHAQVLVLKITEAGRRLMAAADPLSQVVEERLTAGFTPAEAEQFRDYLVRALNNLTD